MRKNLLYNIEPEKQRGSGMSLGVLGALGSPLLGYTLQALIDEGVEINAVMLDASGGLTKDIKIWNQRTDSRLPFIRIENFASHQIPFYFFKNHNSNGAVDLVNTLNLDLLLNGGTPRILKPSILSAPSLGVLNIHPGKLPDYKGCTCVEWAIYNNEQIFNTVHYMTEEVDGGDVVIDEGYSFTQKDRYVDVRVEVYKKGFALLAKAARIILENKGLPHARTQNGKGKYYKPIPEDCLIKVVESLESGKYSFQQTTSVDDLT